MLALLAGIRTLFTTGTTDLNTALSGRLYTNNPLEGTTYPYGVVRVASIEPDYTFDSKMEVVSVEFSFYSEARGVTEIGDIYDDCKTMFDDCTLTVSGYTFVKMERVGGELLRDEEEDNWQYDVEYEVWLHQ